MLWSLVFITVIGSAHFDDTAARCNTEIVNLTALTTSQSSNYTVGVIPYSSERAVDGNETQCAHTNPGAENTSWWRIDLQGVFKISCILIYNFAQSNTDITGAQIYIGNSREKNGRMYENITKFDQNTWNNFKSDEGVSGRYINVSFPKKKALILCEVKIYGTKKESPFVLIKENKTWEEALYYCRDHHTDLHTDLASILDEETQTWAELEARKAETAYVWLGLRYTCTLEFWFWVEDHRLDFTHWAQANPVEECDMSVAMDTKEEHHWFSKNDMEKLNFICQK